MLLLCEICVSRGSVDEDKRCQVVANAWTDGSAFIITVIQSTWPDIWEKLYLIGLPYAVGCILLQDVNGFGEKKVFSG
jgi:hypothetical protein